MASEHWMSRSTIGDFFAFTPFRGSAATNWYKYAPSIDENFQFANEDQRKIPSPAKPSFNEFDFDERLTDALFKIGIKIPTNR